MPGPARDSFHQVTHYLARRVRFDTANVAAGVEFPFSLPDGAFHTATHVQILTIFNGGTNTLTVGNASSDTAYADSTSTAPGVLGVRTTITGTGLVTGDTTPKIKFTSTGGAPTTGEAIVSLSYLPRIS